VYAASSSLDVTDSTFSNNAENGIFADANSIVAGFASSTATGNGQYGIELPANSGGSLQNSSGFAGNTLDGIALSGDTIDTSQTWQAQDSPCIVLGQVLVEGPTDPVLTVSDGAIVQFGAAVNMYVGYDDDGSLHVDGTGTGVLFTSAQPVPDLSDWGGITFGSKDKGSRLDGLTIEYGGGNGYGNLYITSVASPTFVNVTSQYSGKSGLYVGGGAGADVSDSSFVNNNNDGVTVDASSHLAVTGNGPSFTNNVMTSNAQAPITLPAGSLAQLDKTSTFAGNSLPIQCSGGTVASNGTWQSLDEDVQINGNTFIEGPLNPTITIQDGATYLMGTSVGLYVGYNDDGYVTAAGSPSGAGILFTSPKALPGPNDWQGIYLYAHSTGSSLTATTVEYGGSNGYGNIYAYATDVTLSHVTSRYSGKSGVGAYSSVIAATDSTFTDNNDDGIFLDSSSSLSSVSVPSFKRNQLHDNGKHPITLPIDSVRELDTSSSYDVNGDLVHISGGTARSSGTWRHLDEDYYVATPSSSKGL